MVAHRVTLRKMRQGRDETVRGLEHVSEDMPESLKVHNQVPVLQC